ncbi:MAG TPA: hypothetical protein VG253_20520 [Streptosporangiaceae bacterium]|jgi:hypothetical protein|nr:hypothetical protein [Streptosporangiaceae bacterium]
MSEPQIRALFTEIADREPARSQVDIQLARRRGRARLRRRRANVAGISVVATAAVVILAMGVGPVRLGSGPPAGRPAAPRQFNPLVPYLSFGWLPEGNRLVAGDARPEVVALVAGRKLSALSNWNLTVYAAGQCQLTRPAGDLKCSTEALEGLTARISGRAPAVQGHRAFWAGPGPISGLPPALQRHRASRSDSYLLWQYARGGWAGLVLPTANATKLSAAQREAYKQDAVKIANHVRYGAATPPLVFPAQLTGLPSRWRVGSVYYQPDGRLLRASRFALTTGTPDLGADGGMEFQTNLPYFGVIDPATFYRNFCPTSGSEIINGYRVVVTNQVARTLPSETLCAANADGLALSINQQGAHPPISVASLFRDHLRLLGSNPANWTTKPIG